MSLKNGHGTSNGNANTHMDNGSMMDDTNTFQQQQQQQWNYGGNNMHTPFYSGDTSGFPFPGLMNIGMGKNNGAMYGGAPMGTMTPDADQSYHITSGSGSPPVTPFNQARSTQTHHSQHQENQEQAQQQSKAPPSSFMDDTKPVAKASPGPDLSLLSRKRAEVIASLKQRASSQTVVLSSPPSPQVQAGYNTGSPTAGGKDSAAPISSNEAGPEQPSTSASKRPALVKANTITGLENSAADTNMPGKNDMNVRNKGHVQTPQPEVRKSLDRRTTDVDRLLAECRAVAESSTKDGNGRSSTGTTSLRRAKTGCFPDPKDHGQNNDNDRVSTEEGKYNSHITGNEDTGAGKENHDEPVNAREHYSKDEGDGASTASVHGVRSEKRPSQSGNVLERRLYEPPKRTSTVDDSVPPARFSNSLTWRKSDDKRAVKTNPPRPAGQARAPAPLPQKPEFEHDFMYLSHNDVEEIKEWLVITGFHDEEYRRKLVARRRKYAALQADMAELMREEQEEKDKMMNRVEMPRGSFQRATPQPPQPPQLPAERIPHDGPPPFKYSKNKPSAPQATSANAVPVVPEVRTQEHASAAVGANNEVDHREVDHPAEHLKSPAIGQKRSVPSYDEECGGRPKMARTNTNTDDKAGGNGEDSTKMVDENAGAPIKHQNMHRDRELLLQQPETEVGPLRGRGAYMDFEDGSPEGYSDCKYHSQTPFRGRSRGRGRGGRGAGYAPRAGMRGGCAPHFNPPRPHHSKASVNNGRLTHENTRFFLIKSLSYGYVEDSQRDGTWATQLKNVDKLIEAYNGSANVIFFFSVNQSRAFQGYARMESLPDDKKAPRPEWASKLTWECSAPFRIKWLNAAETRFSWVAHLKNAYHEDSTVFFGRDGQEIDPYSGAEMCLLLDQHGVKGKK